MRDRGCKVKRYLAPQSVTFRFLIRASQNQETAARRRVDQDPQGGDRAVRRAVESSMAENAARWAVTDRFAGRVEAPLVRQEGNPLAAGCVEWTK